MIDRDPIFKHFAANVRDSNAPTALMASASYAKKIFLRNGSARCCGQLSVVGLDSRSMVTKSATAKACVLFS
jgi:hypothetical protein